MVVLGFLFPDRGYEQVIAALPPGIDLVCLGRPADGHADLPEQLARQAEAAGHRLRVTGFVPDPELAGALHAAGIPVAPNQRVGARRRSPPGSATAGGRWCRTRRTPGSWPPGPPAR